MLLGLAGLDDQAFEAAIAARLFSQEASIDEGIGEFLVAFGAGVAVFARVFPGGEQLAVGREGERAAVLGAVLQPLLDGVLIVEVLGGGGGDDLGRGEADALPFAAAVDGPAQNGGFF